MRLPSGDLNIASVLLVVSKAITPGLEQNLTWLIKFMGLQ